jgi:hypothetical protein
MENFTEIFNNVIHDNKKYYEEKLGYSTDKPKTINLKENKGITNEVNKFNFNRQKMEYEKTIKKKKEVKVDTTILLEGNELAKFLDRERWFRPWTKLHLETKREMIQKYLEPFFPDFPQEQMYNMAMKLWRDSEGRDLKFIYNKKEGKLENIEGIIINDHTISFIK